MSSVWWKRKRSDCWSCRVRLSVCLSGLALGVGKDSYLLTDVKTRESLRPAPVWIATTTYVGSNHREYVRMFEIIVEKGRHRCVMWVNRRSLTWHDGGYMIPKFLFLPSVFATAQIKSIASWKTASR